MEQQLKSVKLASLKLATLTSEQKNQALSQIRDAIIANTQALIKANYADLELGKDSLSEAMLSRLKLDESKIKTLIAGLNDVINMKDPVGEITLQRDIRQGLGLQRVSTPIGVIAIVFESRPDVAIQITSLLLKSGNAGVLKGGSEAKNTLAAISKILTESVQDLSFMPKDWIHFIQTREDVGQLLKWDSLIDLVIPRGSNQLVQSIMSSTKIPVLGHADGICHLYFSEDFDLAEGLKIVYDSKMQSPGTCNALETLLVHERRFEEVKSAIESQFKDIHLQLSPKSWSIEYSGPELAIKSVKSLSEAIDHINSFGSHHTDGILTHNVGEQSRFFAEVDSANVFSNCSTRFSDGFRYGFGAEVGISTSKIHARGPVGVEGLLSYKYQLVGNGHLVGE